MATGDTDAVLTFSLMVNDGFDTSAADTVHVTITKADQTITVWQSKSMDIQTNAVFGR